MCKVFRIKKVPGVTEEEIKEFNKIFPKKPEIFQCKFAGRKRHGTPIGIENSGWYDLLINICYQTEKSFML